MTSFSVIALDEHDAQLRAHLFADPNVEGAAYILCRTAKVASDPWDRQAHIKLLVKEVLPIDPVSASRQHVTWSTESFVRLLRRAQKEALVIGIVHSHPQGAAEFSTQDDENEAELLRTGCNRNGQDLKLLSLLYTPNGQIVGRVWQYPQHQTEVRSLMVIGERIQVFSSAKAKATSAAFARQVLAFGADLTSILKRARVAVIGAGGTGSATATLLERAGVGQLLVIDEDVVDITNLNRLHGATQSDADAMRPKVDVAAREIAAMGLGTRVLGMQSWVNDERAREALKACDIIFCCTDDHAGRIFLNRFAYFYLTPVFDMGLAMAIGRGPNVGMADISARVTTVMPPEPCLLCRGAVDLEVARAEDLRRKNPEEFERRKREAYVRGAGNPNPAVVTFTTETACMAVNELLNRIVGFRRKNMGSELRRRFLFSEDRSTSAAHKNGCPICSERENWGIGDVDPFLDIVG